MTVEQRKTSVLPNSLIPNIILLLTPFIYLLSGCTPALPELGESKMRDHDGMTMVFVPAGTFMMGTNFEALNYSRKLCKDGRGKAAIPVCGGSTFANELPTHSVRLDGFWIDRTEVTNGQYQGCVEDQACTPPAELGSYTRTTYFGNPAFSEYPVIWVTRDQAADYCSWTGGRLPSEAEWEYAARGPENHIFPWGDTFEQSYVNYCDASCPLGVIDASYDDGYPETAPVGSFPAGESWCGALDMAGNVREWVSDWFSYYTMDPQVNPVGPAEGKSHIPKGGSWLDTPDDLRSANRGENTPDYVRHKVGFRCAQGLD